MSASDCDFLPLLPVNQTGSSDSVQAQDRPQPPQLSPIYQTPHWPYRAVPLRYWQSDNKTSTAVLPHLRATQKGNLARPHSRSPQAVRKPEGPAMHCHLHWGDWSFHLTNEKKKKLRLLDWRNDLLLFVCFDAELFQHPFWLPAAAEITTLYFKSFFAPGHVHLYWPLSKLGLFPRLCLRQTLSDCSQFTLGISKLILWASIGLWSMPASLILNRLIQSRGVVIERDRATLRALPRNTTVHNYSTMRLISTAGIVESPRVRTQLSLCRNSFVYFFQESWVNVECSWPEWWICTIYHAWDTPFWSGTLDILAQERLCSLGYSRSVQTAEIMFAIISFLSKTPPRWPSGKASASRAEDPGFESRLCRDFFWVDSHQWLQNWHSSGYPARRLALQRQRRDWSARCQYTVTGWGRKLDRQILSQCGST